MGVEGDCILVRRGEKGSVTQIVWKKVFVKMDKKNVLAYNAKNTQVFYLIYILIKVLFFNWLAKSFDQICTGAAEQKKWRFPKTNTRTTGASAIVQHWNFIKQKAVQESFILRLLLIIGEVFLKEQLRLPTGNTGPGKPAISKCLVRLETLILPL